MTFVTSKAGHKYCGAGREWSGCPARKLAILTACKEHPQTSDEVLNKAFAKKLQRAELLYCYFFVY